MAIFIGLLLSFFRNSWDDLTRKSKISTTVLFSDFLLILRAFHAESIPLGEHEG
jgi:hypothetical protein